MVRNNKGVSLIVLSITILVMAILAATAIIALEDSGIIGRSKNTTAKQNYTEEYTRLQVIKNGILTDNLGEITVDEYITELQNKGLIESGVTTNADGSKSVTTKTGFVANVMQDGESNVIISLGTSNATIALNPTSLSGDITNGTINKTIIVNATNITGDITWTTSNANVATVVGTNTNATIMLKGIGTATITATYGNAKAICNVTVTGEVSNSTENVTIANLTVSPTEFGSTSEVEFNFTVDLEKKIPNEQLTLNYRFYDVNAFTGVTTYNSQYDLNYTTTSTTFSITQAVSGLSGYGKIELYVLNSDNDIVATHMFNDFYMSATDSYYTFYVACLPTGTLILVEENYEDENGNKKKRRKKKKIEDLTYDDDLVVWDFDNGCFTTAKALWLKEKEYAEEYNLLTFSDGSTLKTIRQHRIFNKELGKFTYPMSDETPIGTTTFNESGKEVTLVAKEVIIEPVAFYNVISEYHMNVFADSILTSCRLSNLYDIKYMKYVKDDRELTSEAEFVGIPEEYIKGLRLREQPIEVNRGIDDNHGNTLRDYVNNLIRFVKKG